MTASGGANKPSDRNKGLQNGGESSGDEVEEFVDGIMFKFDSGDHVLSRWRDGQAFVATVEKIDVSGRKMHVRYEDGTRSWADVKDVRTEAAHWDVATCSQCLLRKAEFRHLPAAERAALEEAKSKEQLYKCYDCGWNYHESCHTPRLTPDFLAIHGGSAHFICRTCVFMRVAKAVAEEREKLTGSSKVHLAKRDLIFQQNATNFSIFEHSKRHLPYSLDELMWKEQHTANEQNSYCYCGGPAKWHFHMFQCATCRQWFHENCVRASVLLSSKTANKPPINVPTLLLFDTFYTYACARCSPDGFDSIARYPISWLDLITLCALNVSEGRAKISLRHIILPWLKEHVKDFILASSEERIPTTDNEWLELMNVIKSSPARFTSSFGSQPGKSSSPAVSAQIAAADPWCQLKNRAMLPRRLPEIKTLTNGNQSAAAQRHMRIRAKKSNSETVDDSLNEDQQSTTTSSSVLAAANNVPGKRGRKHALSEAATEKVLKKMAGVAQLQTIGYVNNHNLEGPDLPNTAPFYRLMPSLHNPVSKPLSVAIPSSDSYFSIGKGEYALVQPLHIDVTGTSISPAVSSCSPSTHLVGAKKRKAYRPLHSISASANMNRRQSHDQSGSDGISNVSSISPITMLG